MKKKIYQKGINFKCQGSANCCVSRGSYGFVYLSNIDLKKLTYIEDNILMKWYFENSNKDQVPVNKVTKMFKKFKL